MDLLLSTLPKKPGLPPASPPSKTSLTPSLPQEAPLNGSEYSLSVPEWFRTTALPGQVFRTLAVRETYVEAYGGDKQLCGRRQFRNFPLDTGFIAAEAPPFSKKSTGLRGCIE